MHLRETRGVDEALEQWRYLMNDAVYYTITPQIVTVRTFARDQNEAVYIDHMARAMHDLPQVQTVQDTPPSRSGTACSGAGGKPSPCAPNLWPRRTCA